MPQYTPEQIEGIKRTFVLYVKFPKSRWGEIRKAEGNTPEADRIYNELKDEFMNKYFVAPKDNPKAELPFVADLEYGITSLN